MIPGMGVSPEQQAAMQAVSKFIKGEIRVDYAECTVNLKLSSSNPEAVAILPDLVGQLGQALAEIVSAGFLKLLCFSQLDQGDQVLPDQKLSKTILRGHRASDVTGRVTGRTVKMYNLT